MQTVNACRCGAEIQPNANFCWLCGEKIVPPQSSNDNDAQPIVANVMIPRVEQQVADGSVVAAIFILVSMLIVILGVFLYSKGLALVLAFVFLPIILATTLRMKSQPSPSSSQQLHAVYQSTATANSPSNTPSPNSTSKAGAVATGIGAVLLSVIMVVAGVALTALAMIGGFVIFLLSICSEILSQN